MLISDNIADINKEFKFDCKSIYQINHNLHKRLYLYNVSDFDLETENFKKAGLGLDVENFGILNVLFIDNKVHSFNKKSHYIWTIYCIEHNVVYYVFVISEYVPYFNLTVKKLGD
ncbi:MAG: hypothetical protein AABY22_20395 [Nanoarchaeota archaeon]